MFRNANVLERTCLTADSKQEVTEAVSMYRYQTARQAETERERESQREREVNEAR